MRLIRNSNIFNSPLGDFFNLETILLVLNYIKNTAFSTKLVGLDKPSRATRALCHQARAVLT